MSYFSLWTDYVKVHFLKLLNCVWTGTWRIGLTGLYLPEAGWNWILLVWLTIANRNRPAAVRSHLQTAFKNISLLTSFAEAIKLHYFCFKMFRWLYIKFLNLVSVATSDTRTGCTDKYNNRHQRSPVLHAPPRLRCRARAVYIYCADLIIRTYSVFLLMGTGLRNLDLAWRWEPRTVKASVF